MTREEVVQAALTVERWCMENWRQDGKCDCPLRTNLDYCMCTNQYPGVANLEYHLRTSGLSKKAEKPREVEPWHCHDCRQYPCWRHDENPDYDTPCEHFELW